MLNRVLDDDFGLSEEESSDDEDEEESNNIHAFVRIDQDEVAALGSIVTSNEVGCNSSKAGRTSSEEEEEPPEEFTGTICIVANRPDLVGTLTILTPLSRVPPDCTNCPDKLLFG